LSLVNFCVNFLKKLNEYLPFLSDIFTDSTRNILTYFIRSHQEVRCSKSCVSSNLTDTSLETPDSCIVTPYNASASSIVPFRCVITINCVSSLNSCRKLANRSTFASSNAASTSSKIEKGTDRTYNMANNIAMAVSDLSPPDNNPNVFNFFPGGLAAISIPVQANCLDLLKTTLHIHHQIIV